MATTKAVRFQYNMISGSRIPYTILGKFQAGSTQEIDEGEILELSSGNWIPLDADQAMAGIIAVSHGKVKSGDLAGYRRIIVPRPGDVFEVKLLSTDAQNPDRGTAVYYSTSEEVTTTAGSNVLGHTVGHDGFPQEQGHQADDASVDRGTTIANCPDNKVLITIKEGASYYNALQGDDA